MLCFKPVLLFPGKAQWDCLFVVWKGRGVYFLGCFPQVPVPFPHCEQPTPHPLHYSWAVMNILHFIFYFWIWNVLSYEQGHIHYSANVWHEHAKWGWEAHFCCCYCCGFGPKAYARKTQRSNKCSMFQLFSPHRGCVKGLQELYKAYLGVAELKWFLIIISIL